MKLTRYEQETIVNYNVGEQTATLYIRDKAVMRKHNSTNRYFDIAMADVNLRKTKGLSQEELAMSVSTLLEETVQEECLSEENIKNICCLLVLACAIIAVVFIAFATMNSEYLNWDFNNPELTIVGTILHGF